MEIMIFTVSLSVLTEVTSKHDKTESLQLTNLYSKYGHPSKTIDYIVVFFLSIARKHWLAETTVNTVCSLCAVINSLRASSPFGEVSRSRARAPPDRIRRCEG